MQKRLTTIVLVAIAALSLLASGARAAQDGTKAEDGAKGEEVAPGLYVGDMLDQSNCQLAKDLLPPEDPAPLPARRVPQHIVSYPVGRRTGRSRSSRRRRRTPGSSTSTNAVGRLLVDQKQPRLPVRHPVPEDRSERSQRRCEDRLESVPRLLVRRQLLQPDSGGDAARRREWTARFTPTAGSISGTARRRSTGWTTRSICRVSSSVSRPFPTDLQGTSSLTWRYRDPRSATRCGPSCRRCAACAR